VDNSCINLSLVNISALTCDFLGLVLENQENIRIVGSAATAEELQELLREKSPDVSLVGTKLRDSSALPFLELIAATRPSVRQIVLSVGMTNEDVSSLLRSGARGLLCESKTNVEMLLKCIRCVSSGQIWADSEQLDALMHSLSMPRFLNVTNVMGDLLLSKREEQVLRLVADGLSNRAIATLLKLSEHTVKNHIFRIFDKLGVSNRMEAVLYAASQRKQRAMAAA
jgi:DNA-binding NarL/FixJ family response regulator